MALEKCGFQKSSLGYGYISTERNELKKKEILGLGLGSGLDQGKTC